MDRQTTVAAVQKAIGAHGAWKLKFRNAARTGQLPDPVDTIAADDQCEFGKLLKTLAPHMDGDADYVSIRKMHKDFHANAGRLAQLIASGNSAHVARELGEGSAFERQASALSGQLADWRVKLKYRN